MRLNTFDAFIVVVLLVLIWVLVYSAIPDYHKANVMLYTCSGKLLHVWEGATDIEDDGRSFKQAECDGRTMVSGGVVVVDPYITKLNKPKERK